MANRNKTEKKAVILDYVVEWKVKVGQKWRKDEEKEVSSYWIILRKREDAGNWKGKH